MYEIPAGDAQLAQGDIFRGNFLFPYTHDVAEEVQLIREHATVPEGEVADAWATGSEVLVLPAHRTVLAIILSNTCDLVADAGRDPLEFVTLGAMLPIERLPHEREKGNCRRNRFIRYHYLEPNANPELEESYVHFGLTSLVRQESLSQFRDSRILSLRSPHRESLGHRFGEFVSRIALPR